MSHVGFADSYEPPDTEAPPNLWTRLEDIEEALAHARFVGLYDLPDDHAPKNRAVRDALRAFDESDEVKALLYDIQKAVRRTKQGK